MFYIPAAGRASAADKLDTRQQYLLVTKVIVTGFYITLLPDIALPTESFDERAYYSMPDSISCSSQEGLAASINGECVSLSFLVQTCCFDLLRYTFIVLLHGNDNGRHLLIFNVLQSVYTIDADCR